MKKILLFFSTLALVFSFALTASAANSITNRLKGRLLLQVQQGGAIWYVNPSDSQKYSVTFANALNLFQNFALGITDNDLVKIPVNLESIRPNLDTDNDGYIDVVELVNGYDPYKPGDYKYMRDDKLANRLKGRLLLQVQQGGAIWYVDYTGTRYSVRWDNLMDLFTRLALGITDKDLGEVGNAETTNWQTYKNSEYGFEFKYPNNWKTLGDQTICEGDCINKDNIQIVKVVYGVNADGSVNDRNSYLERFASGGGYLKISVIGGKGYYDVNETKGGPSPEIYLVGEEEIFLMNFNIFDSSKTALLEAEKLFKQIISTFKFLD